MSYLFLNSSECYNLDTDFDILDESEKLNYIIYLLDKLKEEIEFISSVRSNTLNKLSLIRKELNHFEKLLVDYNKKNNIEYKKLPKHISRFISNNEDLLSNSIDESQLNSAKTIDELHELYTQFAIIVKSNLYDKYNTQFEPYLNLKNVNYIIWLKIYHQIYQLI